MRRCDAEEFARVATRRADLWRGSQRRRTADALRDEIALSGESLLATAEGARRFGLVAVEIERVEGYMHIADWESVQNRFGLEADAEGAILIHRAPSSGPTSA